MLEILLPGSPPTGDSPFPPMKQYDCQRVVLKNPDRVAPFYAAGSDVRDGKIYTAGGINASPLINTNAMNCIDLNELTIRKLPTTLPNAIRISGAAFHGEDLFICGGLTSVFIDRVQRYNVRTEALSNMSPLPQKDGAFQMTSHEGELFKLRGNGSETGTNFLTRYNVASNTWSRKTETGTKPKVSYGGHLSYHEGYLYTLTGRDIEQSIFRINLDTSVWEPFIPNLLFFNKPPSLIVGDLFYAHSKAGELTIVDLISKTHQVVKLEGPVVPTASTSNPIFYHHGHLVLLPGTLETDLGPDPAIYVIKL